MSTERVEVSELAERIAPARRSGPKRSPRAGDRPKSKPRRRSAPSRLILYVSAGSLPCVRAEMTVRSVLKSYSTDVVLLDVRDVEQNIERAHEDRVIYTPTLICRNEKGDTRLLGDLTHVPVLLDVLEAMGLEPSSGVYQRFP